MKIGKIKTIMILMLAILISGCIYPKNIEKLEEEPTIAKLEKELTIIKLKLEIKEYQQQLAKQKRISDNLAITLSRLNALIDNQNLVDQVNAMLIKNGYKTLIRQEEVIHDSLNNKKEKDN